MVSHPKTPILNCFYHLLWFYFLTVSEFSCLAKSFSVLAWHLCPTFLTSTISPKRVHMKCLMLSWRPESVQFSSFVIEALCLYLHCLSAALLCYTGFQTYSFIRSTSCSCSTCCFGLGFQLQNLQDFIKISRALIKDIFPVAETVPCDLWNRP